MQLHYKEVMEHCYHSLMALYHNKEVSFEITSFGLEGEMF